MLVSISALVDNPPAMSVRPYAHSEYAERWEELYNLRLRVLRLGIAICVVGLLASVPYVGNIAAVIAVAMTLALVWSVWQWMYFYCPKCGETFFFRPTTFGRVLSGKYGHCSHCGFKQWQ
jgi:predicted RNA-binding Zn-ribbon protein involved in translation (DUF1610 family)